MRLFEVDGDVLSEVGHEAGVAYTTGGRALLALPVFDGGMHLFAGNERGPNFFFKNAGDGTFVEQAEELGIMDAEETVRGATTLDIDADGDLDLVYGNWEGPHRMWAWNGISFDDVTPDEVQTPSRIRTVIAADFDNDGSEELFFNNIGEPNRLFRQNENGEWVSTEIGDALESDGLGTGAAVFDADGDGRLELLVHGESEPNRCPSTDGPAMATTTCVSFRKPNMVHLHGVRLLRSSLPTKHTCAASMRAAVTSAKWSPLHTLVLDV